MSNEEKLKKFFSFRYWMLNDQHKKNFLIEQDFTEIEKASSILWTKSISLIIHYLKNEDYRNYLSSRNEETENLIKSKLKRSYDLLSYKEKIFLNSFKSSLIENIFNKYWESINNARKLIFFLEEWEEEFNFYLFDNECINHFWYRYRILSIKKRRYLFKNYNFDYFLYLENKYWKDDSLIKLINLEETWEFYLKMKNLFWKNFFSMSEENKEILWKFSFSEIKNLYDQWIKNISQIKDILLWNNSKNEIRILNKFNSRLKWKLETNDLRFIKKNILWKYYFNFNSNIFSKLKKQDLENYLYFWWNSISKIKEDHKSYIKEILLFKRFWNEIYLNSIDYEKFSLKEIIDIKNNFKELKLKDILEIIRLSNLNKKRWHEDLYSELFWRHFSSLSKDKIRLFKDIDINEVLEFFENSWTNNLNAFLLKDLFNFKNWKIIFNCWHKCNFDWNMIKRIERWFWDKSCTICNKLNYWRSSLKQRKLAEDISELFDIEVLENQRILWEKYKKEIDILIDKRNIWFEFNWLYYHSEDKDSSFIKRNLSKELWIDLYFIWEHIYIKDYEYVLNEIKDILWLKKNLYKPVSIKWNEIYVWKYKIWNYLI